MGSGVFLMWHARFAYFSVLFVSSKSVSQGEMQEMRTVRELPPIESCRGQGFWVFWVGFFGGR